MTRKEMITACVEDQIARGIIKAENKAMQIKKGGQNIRKNDDYVWIRSDGKVYGLKTKKNLLDMQTLHRYFLGLYSWPIYGHL